MDIQSFVFGMVTVMLLASVGGVVYAIVKVNTLGKKLGEIESALYDSVESLHRRIDDDISEVRRFIDSRVDKSEQNRQHEFLELKGRISKVNDSHDLRYSKLLGWINDVQKSLLRTDIKGQLPHEWQNIK